MYAHEIKYKLTEANFNLSKINEMIYKDGANADQVFGPGTLVNWCVARHAWKDIVHQLELELKDAEFRMFSCFLEKNKKGA